MLLTITTILYPATDLGYLLHKHPARCQSLPHNRAEADNGSLPWCRLGDSVRTGRVVPLFNLRTDNWHDHFRWSPTFTRLKGGAGAASAG